MTVGGLPYNIAFPIFQSSLVFSGFWGLFLFHEIRGLYSITIFFLSVCIVILGVMVLAKYGPQ